MTRGPRELSLVAVGVLVVLACQSPSSSGTGDVPEETPTSEGVERSLVSTIDSLRLASGAFVPYEHGYMTVPMRRDTSSASIEVEYHRFRHRPTTSESDPGPAIVLLRGGPGGDGLDPLLARSGYFETQLAHLTDVADVIVPGQRGFGSSFPTPCSNGAALRPDEAWDADTRRRLHTAAVVACRAEWEARGVDLSGFDVVEAAADVADLVRSLGYEEVQVVGGSFGAHWAITVLRTHPGLAMRATLSALEGPDHTFDEPSGVAASLARIAAAADTADAWKERIPADGLIETYRTLIASAHADRIVVEAVEPETDSIATVALGPDELRELLRGYSTGTQFPPQIARWPGDVLAMLEGDLEPAASELLWRRTYARTRDAAYYEYECSSGVSVERLARLASDPAIELVGEVFGYSREVCDAWGSSPAPWFHQPFTSDVPSVLVHGTWDTSTPMPNAVELRPSFEDHHFVTVDGGSHGAFREALEDVPGFMRAMQDWWRMGDASGLPERVGLPPVRWRSGR